MASALSPQIVRTLLARAIRHHSPLWSKCLPLIGPKTTTDFYEWTAEAGRYKGEFMDAMNAAGVDVLLCPVRVFYVPLRYISCESC